MRPPLVSGTRTQTIPSAQESFAVRFFGTLGNRSLPKISRAGLLDRSPHREPFIPAEAIDRSRRGIHPAEPSTRRGSVPPSHRSLRRVPLVSSKPFIRCPSAETVHPPSHRSLPAGKPMTATASLDAAANISKDGGVLVEDGGRQEEQCRPDGVVRTGVNRRPDLTASRRPALLYPLSLLLNAMEPATED